MLFIYWLEANPQFGDRVAELLQASISRGDKIFTSIITIGEVLVLPVRNKDLEATRKIERFFDSDLITILPVTRPVVNLFAEVRAGVRPGFPKVAPADALHLACAGAHGIDLFLTNDKDLHRQQIPGIQFIAGLDVNVL
jgi:predicted nucleic acid-binding protein